MVRLNEEPEIKTVDQLAEKIRDLASRGGRENAYVQIPDVNMNRVIVSNSDVHEHAKDYWFKRFQDQNDQMMIVDSISTQRLTNNSVTSRSLHRKKSIIL